MFNEDMGKIEPGASQSDGDEVKIGQVQPLDVKTPAATDEKHHGKWSLGMLTVSNEKTVPGTVLLLAKNTAPSSSNASEDGPREEKKTTRDGKMILEPQPDDSPNDPLNLPLWRRDFILAALGLYSILGGGTVPLIASGFTDVAQEYNMAPERVALTTGLCMMGQGVGCVLYSSTAILYGKRPVYLASAVFFIAASVWCAASPTFSSLLAARVFQGIAAGVVECLPSSSINEIFYLHEKAYRIGLYTLLLLGGKNLIPLVAAGILQSLSWRWVFWVYALIAAVCMVLLFLCVPETLFMRGATGGPQSEKDSSQHHHPGRLYTQRLRDSPPRTFSQRLALGEGRLSPENWWDPCYRSLRLYTYPPIIWSALVYSCSVGWLIVVSESLTLVFRQGYGFNALQTGLVYLSPFIGGVLGTAGGAGQLGDAIVNAMAGSEGGGGYYEPEYRLTMMVPVALSTVAGLVGFGWSAEAGTHWIVPTVFFGIMSFGCTLGSATAITFTVDSYRQYAGEALTTLNFSKNVFHGLVFSLFITDWLASSGTKSVYGWLGVIQAVVMLTTIPMYIYGKRARLWTSSPDRSMNKH